MKTTNLQKAVEIVRVTPNKQACIERLMNELGVKKGNAFVYHTKASKLLKSGVRAKPVVDTRDVESDMEASEDRKAAVKNMVAKSGKDRDPHASESVMPNPFMKPTTVSSNFQRYVGR